MSINRVCISGNLTRDCETRQTQTGTTVISFGVAVNERRMNQQTQQWEDKPNFVDCVLFDRNGNRQWMANALRKGFKVYVEGRLSYSSWVDRETGKNRSRLEVIVQDIDASWPRKEQAAPPAPQQGYQPPQGYQYAQPAPQQQPVGYQQQPQGYAQPAQAPQAPQPANYAQTAQYAPQQAPQAPAAPAQQQMQMPAQQPMATAPTVDVYDEDIPF